MRDYSLELLARPDAGRQVGAVTTRDATDRRDPRSNWLHSQPVVAVAASTCVRVISWLVATLKAHEDSSSLSILKWSLSHCVRIQPSQSAEKVLM